MHRWDTSQFYPLEGWLSDTNCVIRGHGSFLIEVFAMAHSILLGIKECISCFSISASTTATIYQGSRCCAHFWSGSCWATWSRRRHIGTKPPNACVMCGSDYRLVCRGHAHSLPHRVWRGEGNACNLVKWKPYLPNANICHIIFR